jgi:anion-transporting  ArsA/GET3 family ATPase
VDCIVLDGPASGHALSLARSPKNFARLTKRGPLFRDASGMEEYFQSPKALTLLITLPELLSVTETIETKAEIQNDFKNVKIVINKILPEPEKNILAITPPPYQNAIRYYCERSEKENAAIKKLNEWEFPYFLQKNTLPEIRSLAQKKWEEINE